MTPFDDRPGADEISAWVMAALAAHPGERALLLHDLDRMRARLSALAAAFPPDTLHAVAIKANPLVSVLRAIVEAGFGLEAASWEEVCLALAAGCPPDQVVYDAPAKTDDELAAAVTAGVYINADDLTELARLDALGPVSAGLRVNPLVGGGRIAATSVAGRSSHFGVPVDRLDDIIDAFRRYPWLDGLHVHTGSQGMPVDRLIAGATAAQALADTIRAALGEPRPARLDVGGGLPTRYREDDPPVPLDAWAEGLSDAGLFDDRYRLITEPGRAIHAGCGVAVAGVASVKPAPDTANGDAAVFAIVHLGADLLLRRVYRPDDWHHDLLVLDAAGRPKHAPPVPTTVCGPLCFGGDVLAREVMLPAVAPGDWIVLRDTGAYTLSMWSRHCSRGMPLVLGIDAGWMRVLRRAERADDVVRFWSEG